MYDSLERVYNSALKFLSYRPRSEKEVVDRLKLKSQSSKVKIITANAGSRFGGTTQNSKVIDQVILKLKKYKFIDDLEFAKKWVESRMRFKPRSWRLIKIELKQKGISQEIIGRMINDEGLMINDLESAKKLVEKRIERIKALPKQEIYEKLGRYLASKGFNWDTIKKSIDEMLSEGV